MNRLSVKSPVGATPICGLPFQLPGLSVLFRYAVCGGTLLIETGSVTPRNGARQIGGSASFGGFGTGENAMWLPFVWWKPSPAQTLMPPDWQMALLNTTSSG